MICENSPMVETERLVLRRFTPDDTEALFELISDEETNQFLPWFPVKSFDEAGAFLRERFLSYDDRPSDYRYAICEKQANRPIGYVWLADHESHDFGYGLKRAYWHKGIVTEAAKAVVDRIRRAGYPYITATHDVNNPRSGLVMKKLGMTYRYSYVEDWQPKNFPVTFRMYQLNFIGDADETYWAYWRANKAHFIEEGAK